MKRLAFLSQRVRLRAPALVPIPRALRAASAPRVVIVERASPGLVLFARWEAKA